MRILQNQEPVAPEKDNTALTYRRRISLFGVLFLVVILLIFVGIVYHYSRFESGGEFVLLTEEKGTVTEAGGEFEYQRLLVRNRYPFVLVLTARLCRIDGVPQQPTYIVLRKDQYTVSGELSWYSGTYEARFAATASNDGRFTVTSSPISSNDLQDGAIVYENLPPKTALELTKALKESRLSRLSEISEGKKIPSGEDYHWFCELPGNNTDKVLVITLRPSANYK